VLGRRIANQRIDTGPELIFEMGDNDKGEPSTMGAERLAIRRATTADAAEIAAIHVQAWQVGYRGVVPEPFLQSLSVGRREAAWRESLASADSEVWVAEADGRMLGWISVGDSRDPDAGETTAELWAIYVDPACWRRGVGRALWQQAEAHLVAAGFRSVTLWVLESNTRAVSFYEAFGFTPDPGHAKTLERGGVQLVEIRLRRCLSSGQGHQF
jgi:ribosomal protein S18 acetylase RimI-like enzyme